MMFTWMRFLDRVGKEGCSETKLKKSDSCNYALLANIQHSFEPQTYEEAKEYPKWKKTIKVEYDALMRYQR